MPILNKTKAGEHSLYSIISNYSSRASLYKHLSLQQAGRTQHVYEGAAKTNANANKGLDLLRHAAAREFPYLVQTCKWARLSKIIAKHPDLMFQTMDFIILEMKIQMTPLEYCCFVRDKYIREMCDRSALTDKQREQFNLTIQKFKPAPTIPDRQETLAEDGFITFMENYVEPWLEEYELEELPTDTKQREERVIYLACTNTGLRYEVLGLTADHHLVTYSGLIAWQHLPEKFPKNLPDILRSNGECLIEILQHTSAAKHTTRARGVTINSMREYVLINTQQMSFPKNNEAIPSYCLQAYYWVIEAYLVLDRRMLLGDPLVSDAKLDKFWQKMHGFAQRYILLMHMRMQMQAAKKEDDSDRWAIYANFDETDYPVDCHVLDRRNKDDVYIDIDCDDNPGDIFGEDFSVIRGVWNRARLDDRSDCLGGASFARKDLRVCRRLDIVRRSELIRRCEELEQSIEHEACSRFGL